MAYDIIIGRSEEDRKQFGKKGTILLGKHYVKMGATTSLSNEIYLDVLRSHVVFVSGKRGSGKCLHGDTLITLNDGSLRPIKELEKNEENIFSLNPELKIIESEKSNFFKRAVNKLLKLKLRSGKEIKLTPEHPLLTLKGWCKADRLTMGSRIAIPRKIPAFGDQSIKECEVKLLAYLIAEGHLSNNFVLFSNKDNSIIMDFKKSVKDFDSSLKISEHSKPFCYRVSQSHVKRTVKIISRDKLGRIKSSSYNISKPSLRVYIEKLGLYNKLSPDKFIPNLIFKLPKNQIILFLNRLFSCDGSLYKSNDAWQISYSSSSKDIINQVQHLLTRFGIISRIRKKLVNGFKSYEISIYGENVYNFIQEVGFFGEKEEKSKKALRECIKITRNPNVDTIPREIWQIYKPENWAEIGRKIGYKHPKALRESKRYSISRQKLLQIAKADENKLLGELACSDIFWDEIIEIKELLGNFFVYDITVPNNHNFVANDIIVHNSYSMGVVAEGMSNLPEEISKNLAIVIFDTMGIYWTMKYPNRKEKELLDEWNLEAKPLNIQMYTPISYHKIYKDKGIPTDFPFSIRPVELSAHEWCLTFGVSLIEPIGVLIERIISDLIEKKDNFSIDDIIKAIKDDSSEETHIKNAAINRFLSAKSWGLFDIKGTKISEIVKGGQVTVIDVSCYAITPGAEGIRALVIGLVAQKLFIERMIARKKEEYEEVHKYDYFSKQESDTKTEKPLVWLIVDEAHEFLPNEGKTAATNALITILREGRQPGISLILASQQPGKIHTDVMTQSDVVIAHRITAKVDIDALGTLMQSYMREGLDKQLNYLPSVSGAGIVFDDINERLYPMRIRPRFTWHGGSAPIALHEIKKEFEL